MSKNPIQWKIGSAIDQLRRALSTYAPGTRWSVQLTEDLDDNILNIFVNGEAERVAVRKNLLLTHPVEETDTSETHKLDWLTVVLIEIGTT